MVVQRSPKPLAWVRFLPPLPMKILSSDRKASRFEPIRKSPNRRFFDNLMLNKTMSKQRKIIITHPRPYEIVGRSFLILGTIPMTLIGEVQGFSHRLLLDLLEVHGKTIMGSSVDIDIPTRTEDQNQIINFEFPFHVHDLNNRWIVQSQGRMAIRLALPSLQFEGDQAEVFLPVIFNIGEPQGGFDKYLIQRHLTIESRVKQYRVDSRKYAEKLGLIMQRRKDFFELSKNTLPDESREVTSNIAEDLSYLLSSIGGDDEIGSLQEQYKESLEWSGPLLHGTIGWLNGFSFQVYSKDHDNHFHVIHREKEINARFSFPGIELISYKGKSNEISNKIIKAIQTYFKKPENFNKLAAELSKQVSR